MCICIYIYIYRNIYTYAYTYIYTSICIELESVTEYGRIVRLNHIFFCFSHGIMFL